MKVTEYMDILRPLNDSEINELLQLYKNKYGTGNFHYLTIYTHCKWTQKLSEIENSAFDSKWLAFRKVFYTHYNSDFRKYGTYVCLQQDMMQSVAFYSWQPNFTELLECLNKTNFIHWSMGPLLINVELPLCPIVKEIVAAKGVTIQRARLCHGLVLQNLADLESNNKHSLPTGYRIEEIHDMSHAEFIHSNWINKKEGSLDYIKGIIAMDKTLAIFDETKNEMVGWILRNEFSGLGLLEVLPTVQRQGFGTILAAALSKLAASVEPQINLTAWVLFGNLKSESLLEKIGYEKSIVCEWIQVNRKE